MPQRDLVDAYLDGRISRRTLIRRLVAGGISVGAAVSYAHLLRPESASARPARRGTGTPPEYYPDCTIKIKSSDLRKVIKKDKVKVVVRSDGEAETEVSIGYDVGGGTYLEIGAKPVSFGGPERKEVSVPVDTSAFEDKNKAKLRASIDGTGLYHDHAEDTKTIKKG